MTEQLKTLKDFKSNEDNAWNGGYESAKEDLKKEAINQLKYVEECFKTNKHMGENVKTFSTIFIAQKWIKHFFNINDDELK